MEKRTSSNRTAQKKKIDISKILKRPIVKLAILIVVIIAVVLVVKNVTPKNNKKNDTNIEGYQKLVNVANNKYTFVDLDGKVKTYEGYISMDDFYYNTTCVTKIDEESGVTQMALLNKNNKEIIKYGEYNSYSQVVGGKYYKVEKDGLYGVINYKGDVVIKPEYNYISVTTVQEATEVVFECQKDAVYYFINENGKQFYQTDVALHSVSYANKFNDEYETIIYIATDGERKYFNLISGEEVFQGNEDVNISYNILKTGGKISFYDKKAKLKQEVVKEPNNFADARVYFRKYVVIEQSIEENGQRKYQYTLYDDEFKKILESENRINPVQDVNENVYFIINEPDGVKIVNEKKKEVEVKGFEFNGNNISNLQYLVLNPLDNAATYSVYDFKGNLIKENIQEYAQKGFGLVAKTSDERVLLLGGNKSIQLAAEDIVTATDNYLIVENENNETVTVVDKEGNVKVDKASGKNSFFAEKYIAIQSGDNVDLYKVENGKKTFSYNSSEYVNRDEDVNVIELQNGLYTFDGDKIIEK